MEKDEANRLITAYLEGTCTPAEKALIREAYLLMAGTESTDLSADQISKLEASTLVRIARQTKIKKIRTANRRMWPYIAAAMALIFMFVGAFLWENTHQNQETAATHIRPGRNQATMLSASGETILLSEAQAGIRLEADGISYLDGSPVEIDQHRRDTIATQYVLTTPRGGMYTVTLSDGSQVWLNAGTTLKYPSQFDETERVVYLEGEAFFDIKRQPMQKGTFDEHASDSENVPFKVRSNGQTVEVIGTTFNIAAYPDETEIKTTLVAGSVQVINSKSGSIQRLKPGEQSVTHGLTTEINEVNTEQYIAWKNNEFIFHKASISDLMNTLARWYDVEVIYEGEKPTDRYGGGVSRSVDISKVLRLLETAGGVDFRIENRTIYVRANTP